MSLNFGDYYIFLATLIPLMIFLRRCRLLGSKHTAYPRCRKGEIGIVQQLLGADADCEMQNEVLQQKYFAQ